MRQKSPQIILVVAFGILGAGCDHSLSLGRGNTSLQIHSAGQPSSAPAPTYVQYAMASAVSNSELWPASAAIDGSRTTVYSSHVLTSSHNDSVFLAAWLASKQSVNAVMLQARPSAPGRQGFPQTYEILLTSVDNSSWVDIGLYSAQPDPVTNQVLIRLPRTYSTFGVMISPRALGVDDYNNHYFQLAELALALDSGGAAPSAQLPSSGTAPALSVGAAIADGSDVVGKTTMGPDGYGDIHIRLSGVSSPIKSAVITGSGGGKWAYPFDGTNWVVGVVPQSDSSNVDLYFEYYKSYPSYSISLTFADGSQKTVNAARSFLAVSLGQDGNRVTSDGPVDSHIMLTGITTPISKVRILADVGSSQWQNPYDGIHWNVAVKPRSNPTVVDLYFGFNKDWSYLVELTFTDGTSATAWAAPPLKCNTHQSCFDAAVNNLYAHFWTGARGTGYATPTGWIGVVNGSFAGSDSRGSLWPAAMLINTLYSQYVINPTGANAQPILSEWNHIKSVWSDNDLTTVGSSAPVNAWSDDLGANVELLLEIYDVTHDDHALRLVKTALNNGYNHWHNNDSRFGGSLWYTDDHTEHNSAQAQLALDFFRVYQLTGDQTYLAKGEEMYNWFQTHLLHSDNIYYTDYGWWSSDNPATDQPHVNWWGSIHEINKVAGDQVSQAALVGAMGMDVMHARMYRLTGDDQYRQRAIATAQGILKNFVGQNGAFFDARDAWIEGELVRPWILEVYRLLPGDLQLKFKSAFDRTATAVQVNDVTTNGYYGPEWDGPADAVSTNLASEVNNKQSSTNASAVNFIAAPALIDYAESLSK